jgi:hypothetical protein
MWNDVADLQDVNHKKQMFETHMSKIKKDVKVFRP